MPAPLLCVIQDIYNRDEYVLKDGDKTARVRPTRGVKQGCPLSPLLFSMVTMGGDLQPGSLADRLLTGLGQPQINP